MSVRRPGDPAAHVPGTRLLVLADDAGRARDWRAAWPEQDVLVAGDLVDATAHALREPFLELVASLGKRHDSLAWWCSRVSERNTAVSPLFEHCVHVHAALRAAKDGPLCVVCDREPVRRALGGTGRPSRGRWVMEAASRIARFAATFAARRLATRGAPLPGERSRPRALLRTYVDEACLTDDGAFDDRYLPGLADWLETRGYETWTLPVAMNIPWSHRELWARLHGARGRFLPDAAFLRPRDALAAIATGVRAAFLPRGTIELLEVDVTSLFDDERRRTACDLGTLEAALNARLAGVLTARGVTFDLLVDSYENMISEKGVIHGFRRAAPDTYLVGFQHGAMYPLLLCNFAPSSEVPIAPLPDRVVSNGPVFRDILVRAGLPEARVVSGPALRYRHLHDAAEAADQGDVVLVAIPLMDDVAEELLTKVLPALAGHRVVLKPHPMARIAQQLARSGVASLPDGFELGSGMMGPWLERARLVVASASSSLVEAVAAGVPVVVVGRDAALDLNPLEWYPGLAPVVRSSEALAHEAQRLLSLSADERDAWRERARRVLDESFAEVTEERLEAFLPPRYGAGVTPASR